MDLTLRESKLMPEVKILDIEGRIDAYTHIKIQDELDTLLNIGSNQIVCNLSAVEYIGPAGLKTFLSSIKKARESGGDIKLATLQPAVKRIFEFAGFSKICSFYDDVKTAAFNFKRQINTRGFTKDEMYAQTMEGIAPSTENVNIGDETVEADVDLYAKTFEGGSPNLPKDNEIDLYAKTFCDESGNYNPSGNTLSGHLPGDETSTIDVAEMADFTAEITNSVFDNMEPPALSVTKAKSSKSEKIFKDAVQYRIQNKIKEGSLGKLYVGEEVTSCGFSKKIALKYIKKQFSEKLKNVELLTKEVEKASLITHQNISQLYKLVLLNGYYFVIMEYVEGVSLSALIKKLRETNRVFPPQFASLVTYITASSLAYANRIKDKNGKKLDIIHGEVNPDNIIISRNGDIKLVGLGVSKVSNMLLYQDGVVNYKAYTAPENIATKHPTKSGDIFSLGVMFYEMLTGLKPYGENGLGFHDGTMPYSPSQINKKATDIIDGIVLRCLEHNPSARFASFQDIALHLETTLYDKGFSLTQASFEKFLEHNQI